VKKKMVCRAEGSNAIGMGHIMRCIAITEMLKDAFDIQFALSTQGEAQGVLKKNNIPVIVLSEQMDTNFAKSFDVVVLDGYWYDHNYVKELRKQKVLVVQIDDIPSGEYYCDLLINHAVSADYSNATFHFPCKILTGSRYALLRGCFLEAAKKEPIQKTLSTITVTMGGADPLNYTTYLINALKPLIHEFRLKLQVLTGPAFKHYADLNAATASIPGAKLLSDLDPEEMKTLLANTSLLICPASTIVYEACAVGVPTLAFLTAENQRNIYEGLVSSGVVAAGGDLSEDAIGELTKIVSDVIANYGSVSNKMSDQRKLIDGRSGQRIREEISALCN
jgi:UDP-2,4-diacetamido-2,4,6-trideoxy-beta-L-altropyranose hydrolase